MTVGEEKITQSYRYVRNLQMQYHNALAAELFNRASQSRMCFRIPLYTLQILSRRTLNKYTEYLDRDGSGIVRVGFCGEFYTR